MPKRRPPVMTAADRTKKLSRLCAREHMADGDFQLRLFDPQLADLAGVLSGAKPVLVCGARPQDAAYYRGLAAYFNLHCAFPLGEGSARRRPGAAEAEVILGAHRAPVERAAALRLEHAAQKKAPEMEWGALLGYPECCVRAFLAWRDAQVRKRVWNRDRSVRYAAAAAGPGPFSFLLNTVYLFQSCCEMSFPGERENMEKLEALNRRDGSLDLMSLSVIPWHPCSFACGESLAKARAIFRVIEDCLLKRAALLKKTLSRPVVFLDKHQFLALEGASASRLAGVLRVAFDRVAPPFSLLPAGAAAGLAKAGELRLKGGTLLDGRGHAVFSAPPGLPALYLPFSERGAA